MLSLNIHKPTLSTKFDATMTRDKSGGLKLVLKKIFWCNMGNKFHGVPI